MPITNVKLTAPAYDSDTDTPPFAEYAELFLHFVQYSDGHNLVRLIHQVMGTHMVSQGNSSSIWENAMTNESALAAISLTQEEMEAIEAARNAAPLTLQTLNDADKLLDIDLYDVLCMKITGKYRSVLNKVLSTTC